MNRAIEITKGDLCFSAGLGTEVHRVEVVVGELALIRRGDGFIIWELVSRLKKLPHCTKDECRCASEKKRVEN